MKPIAKPGAPQPAGMRHTSTDAFTSNRASDVSFPSSPYPSPPSAAPTTSRIKAAVRVRPLVEAERIPVEDKRHAQDNKSAPSVPTEVIRVVTAAGKLTRPMESAYTLEVLPQPQHSSTSKAKTYAFDYCAGPSTSQTELFTLLDMPSLCEAAMSGQVVTVFCFGQTGSGKTFTLSGRTLAEGSEMADYIPHDDTAPLVSEDGLQYQAAMYVARRLKEMRHAARRKRKSRKDTAGETSQKPNTKMANGDAITDSSKVEIKCSYVELYQETLYDLLQPDRDDAVRCRWSAAAQSFYVEGSLLVCCRSKDDFLMVLREGQRNRQRSSHALNRDSSRSHVVFTIFFDVCVEGDEEEDEEGNNREMRGSEAQTIRRSQGRKFGRLVFVDLAGSERLKKSQSSNSAETGSINKSLFTLGHVLELLSAPPHSSSSSTPQSGEDKPAAKPSFIPYRSSVLTQLLMQSLDGHGSTLMVACVSPSALHLQESLRTLHYAQRARRIRTSPVVRVGAATQQRMELEKMVKELQIENAMLRRALQLPRAGPISEEDVRAQLETLLHTRGATTTESRTTKGYETPFTRADIHSRSRATSSSVPLPKPKNVESRPPVLAAARTGEPSKKAKPVSLSNRLPSPSASSSTPSSEREQESHEQFWSPSPPAVTTAANEDGQTAMNILALLDALPDTRAAV